MDVKAQPISIPIAVDARCDVFLCDICQSLNKSRSVPLVSRPARVWRSSGSWVFWRFNSVWEYLITAPAAPTLVEWSRLSHAMPHWDAWPPTLKCDEEVAWTTLFYRISSQHMVWCPYWKTNRRKGGKESRGTLLGTKTNLSPSVATRLWHVSVTAMRKT